MSTFLFLAISTSHSTARRDAQQRLIVKTLSLGSRRGGGTGSPRPSKDDMEMKKTEKAALEGDRSGVQGPVFGTRSNTNTTSALTPPPHLPSYLSPHLSHPPTCLPAETHPASQSPNRPPAAQYFINRSVMAMDERPYPILSLSSSPKKWTK